MKRIITTTLGVLVIGVIAIGVAIAAPHFQSADSAVNNTGALVVSFDERGLGNDDIDYRLTADATAIFACFNRGGNHPEAANKETVNSEVSVRMSFEPKNGRVVASLTSGTPSAGTFSCPGGQRLVLAAVTYTNIVLTDLTNGVSVTLPDASRIFFDV